MPWALHVSLRVPPYRPGVSPVTAAVFTTSGADTTGIPGSPFPGMKGGRAPIDETASRSTGSLLDGNISSAPAAATISSRVPAKIGGAHRRRRLRAAVLAPPASTPSGEAGWSGPTFAGGRQSGDGPAGAPGPPAGAGVQPMWAFSWMPVGAGPAGMA